MTQAIKDAVFLIDDGSLNGSCGAPVQSGWDADLRAREIPENFNQWGLILSTGKNSRYDVFAKRRIHPINSGKAGFHHTFTLFSGEAFSIAFKNETKDENVLEISAENGFFTVNGSKTQLAVTEKKHTVCGDFLFDDRIADIYIDGVHCGKYGISDSVTDLVKISVKKHSECCIVPHNFQLWVNYLICDKFPKEERALTDKWSFSGKGEAFTDADYNIACNAGNTAELSRSFEKTSGKTELELKYLAGTTDGIAAFSLTSEHLQALTLSDNGTTLLEDKKILRHHQQNVWQTLRIIADTESHSVSVWLNGKYCGSISISDKIFFFDGIKIKYSPKAPGVLKFCDIFVSKVYEYENYVPEPVIPEKNDYIVGINTCSLWRNGGHRGWDVITPFEELKPYLGYYDEGIPETADWEIKWMAEHGIDFEFFCWFNTRAASPIKKTAHSAALHDGYFKAKYKQHLKFAIIWEAVGGGATSITNFREQIVPYWMDYFFSDDRYLTVDGKVVVAVFGPAKLISDFGSEELLKEQLDYLREKVKELGYKGAIFLSCSAPTETLKRCGFDGVYAYNWGEHGYCPDYTKDMISGQVEKNILHVVPTVSTGFNSIAWHGKRYPQMKTEDMAEMFRWIKNDALPGVKDDDWKKKLIMLSTWNEYGEGTYISPSNLCGFGYLDEIRKAFTKDNTPHTDIIPDAEQKARTGYIYPKSRGLLKPLDSAPKSYPDEFVELLEVPAEKWHTENGLELFSGNGSIIGKSSAFDPQMIICGLNIDTSVVKNIRITMKGGSPSGADDRAVLYFLTDSSPAYSESKGAKCEVKYDKFTECNFYVGELETWCGKVTSLRFDPIISKGSFEIKKIELLTDTKSVILTVNGEICKTSVPIKVKDSGIYIPFESKASFGALSFYSEWNKETKQLLLVYEDKEMVFAKGMDSVTVNGTKVILPEPLELFDGLPMLNLQVLCEICGFTYSINGRYIEIRV